MARKNEAKLKKKKEEAAAEEKEILIFTDLRDWSPGRLERRSFARWVEENKLVCFNFQMDAGNITFPFSEEEEVIWWPELCLTPGSSFKVNSHLHVDEPSARYDRFREPLIHKEEERRRALGLVMIEEEASALMHEGRESSQQNVVGLAAEGETVQVVKYTDLRSFAAGEMDIFSFRERVKQEQLLCFNSETDSLPWPHGVEAMWWPDMRDAPGASFRFDKHVYIDKDSEAYGPYDDFKHALATDVNELQVTGDPSHAADAAVKGLNRNSQEDITMFCQQLATVDPGEGFSHATNAAVEGQKTAEPEQMVVFRDLRKQEDEDSWEEEDENEWQYIVDKKGKHKTMKELLITIMRRQDHKFKSLSTSLCSRIDAVNTRIDEVNTSLSLVAERALRSNFGLFLQSQHPECFILQPLTRLKLGYNKKQSLEHLALLCGKGEHNLMRHMPKDAEIDIFVRMNVSGSQDLLKSASSLKMTGPSAGSTTATFTHLAVAEVTRTMSLCNEWQKYQHPTQRECTRSSKLLYKLVQLERGVLACLDHFSASLDVVLGACVISPSFADLEKSEGVLGLVLSKCPSGLDNLQTLYQRGQLWLMDI